MSNTAAPSDPLMPAKIVYICYAVGFIFPVAALGGLIFAYISRGKNPVADSHLTFQIQTFFLGLLFLAIAFVTAFVIIGWFVGLAWAIWAIIRLITGFLLLNDGKPITGTKTLGAVAV